MPPPPLLLALLLLLGLCALGCDTGRGVLEVDLGGCESSSLHLVKSDMSSVCQREVGNYITKSGCEATFYVLIGNDEESTQQPELVISFDKQIRLDSTGVEKYTGPTTFNCSYNTVFEVGNGKETGGEVVVDDIIFTNIASFINVVNVVSNDLSFNHEKVNAEKSPGIEFISRESVGQAIHIDGICVSEEADINDDTNEEDIISRSCEINSETITNDFSLPKECSIFKINDSSIYGSLISDDSIGVQGFQPIVEINNSIFYTDLILEVDGSNPVKILNSSFRNKLSIKGSANDIVIDNCEVRSDVEIETISGNISITEILYPFSNSQVEIFTEYGLVSIRNDTIPTDYYYYEENSSNCAKFCIDGFDVTKKRNVSINSRLGNIKWECSKNIKYNYIDFDNQKNIYVSSFSEVYISSSSFFGSSIHITPVNNFALGLYEKPFAIEYVISTSADEEKEIRIDHDNNGNDFYFTCNRSAYNSKTFGFDSLCYFYLVIPSMSYYTTNNPQDYLNITVEGGVLTMEGGVGLRLGDLALKNVVQCNISGPIIDSFASLIDVGSLSYRESLSQAFLKGNMMILNLFKLDYNTTIQTEVTIFKSENTEAEIIQPEAYKESIHISEEESRIKTFPEYVNCYNFIISYEQINTTVFSNLLLEKPGDCVFSAMGTGSTTIQTDNLENGTKTCTIVSDLDNFTLTMPSFEGISLRLDHEGIYYIDSTSRFNNIIASNGEILARQLSANKITCSSLEVGQFDVNVLDSKEFSGYYSGNIFKLYSTNITIGIDKFVKAFLQPTYAYETVSVVEPINIQTLSSYLPISENENGNVINLMPFYLGKSGKEHLIKSDSVYIKIRDDSLSPAVKPLVIDENEEIFHLTNSAIATEASYLSMFAITSVLFLSICVYEVYSLVRPKMKKRSSRGT